MLTHNAVPKIYNIPTEGESANLQAMRDWIQNIQHPNETITAVGKLDLIQRVLSGHDAIEANSWKLAALGLTLGDALAQAMPGRLKWVMVEDNRGISPALRWQQTDLLIFPVSAVRERVQAGEPLDIYQVYAEYTKMLPFESR
ncbi:MAG: DUF3806 domain-containing protein [Pseudomonadota bacterium]